MKLYNYNLSVQNNWPTLTVLRLIVSMKLKQSLERNIEAENFKAERNSETTWPNHSSDSVGKEAGVSRSACPWLNPRRKSPNTGLRLKQKGRMQKIKQIQVNQVRLAEPTQCITHLLLYNKLLPDLNHWTRKNLSSLLWVTGWWWLGVSQGPPLCWPRSTFTSEPVHEPVRRPQLTCHSFPHSPPGAVCEQL